MRIVPIALKEYFINGTPVEQTIKNHNNIYDFCLRLKTNSKSTPYFTYIDNNYEVVNKKLDRTTRYYISIGGGSLYKEFDAERKSGVNVGYSATLFNKYVKKDIKDYKIDYQFYISECYKIIYTIVDGQMDLF